MRSERAYPFPFRKNLSFLAPVFDTIHTHKNHAAAEGVANANVTGRQRDLSHLLNDGDRGTESKGRHMRSVK